MHNVYARANALFAFMLWILAFVTFACFVTTSFANYTTDVKITVENPRVRNVVDYSSRTEKSDLAGFDFGVNVDFTSVFNWNVKQVFLYLVAEYSTPENPMNQVVVWDKIVVRTDKIVLNEKKLKTKYYFLDDGAHLRNHKNVTLVLRYNVVPNAGYLRLSQASGQTVVNFPATYHSGKF